MVIVVIMVGMMRKRCIHESLLVRKPMGC
jgi:hypothetical protein